MRLVGLAGRAGSGKSLVAQHLCDTGPGESRITGFADLLKLSAARSLGVSFGPDDLGARAVRGWADQLKAGHEIRIVDSGGVVVHALSGRRLLQCFGTEGHREVFGESFWIDQMDFAPEGVDLLVVDDVRFPDEAQAILDHGGEVWLVVRPGVGAAPPHRSERGLPDELITRTILNNGSLDELKAAVMA
jgi:hypothetical protein